VVTEGVTFVPVAYFTDVLKENARYDLAEYTYIGGGDALVDGILRVYGKEGAGNFETAAALVEKPLTEDACAEMYADGVKRRDGVVQYALYSDALREASYAGLAESAFSTGVSSPWVESYEAERVGEHTYQIIKHMKTSAPGTLPDEVVTLTLARDGEYWEIEAIED
jgi:hypothetical protein